MKTLGAILIMASAVAFAASEEPDGLTLPSGFHASVVAEGRYAISPSVATAISTSQRRRIRKSTEAASSRSISMPTIMRTRREHFGSVDGGTGIRFHNDRLYASTPSGVYRFTFRGNELVPSSEPELIVDGMPASHPGFNRVNRPIAFDGKGNLFVALDGSANLCTAQTLAASREPATVGTSSRHEAVP